MNELLIRTLELLKKVNMSLDKIVIDKDEFTEEEENIEDFIKLQKQFENLLKTLEKRGVDDPNWISDRLVDLRLKLAHSEWHLEQIHELVDRLMAFYSDQVDK